MGKSLRSKTKLKYRNERRAKVFEPEEDARRQRLAEKLMANVKQVAKNEKKVSGKQDSGEKEGKDDKDEKDDDMVEDGKDEENKTEQEGSEGMDVDSKAPKKKAATSGWKKKAKKQRSIRRKR